MWAVLKKVDAPLLSLFLAMIGSGLLGTITSVRLNLEGYETYVIGLIASSYNIGILIGCLHFVPFLRRVGHIRAYATCGSLLAVSVLWQSLFFNDYFWALTRFLSGYCFAAIFMVIESWLLNVTTDKIRGRVMAFYMLVAYAGLGLGQLLLNVGDLKSTTPFLIIAMAASLSVIPVSSTRQAMPKIEEVSDIHIWQMFKKIPIGVVGCLVSGAIISNVYSIFPVYFDGVGFLRLDISFLMAATVFGAMFFQWPVGKISDSYDRRKVLFLISFLSFLCCLAIIFMESERVSLMLLLFVLGGMTFTIFPVVLSHSCDLIGGENSLHALQTLLIAYAIGCISGPLLSPIFMNFLGNSGLFVLIAMLVVMMMIICVIRIQVKAPVKDEDKVDFIPMQNASPITPELDPRVEE